MSHLPVKVRDQSDLVSPVGNFSHRSLLRFFPLWLIMQILSFNFVVVEYIRIKKASPNTVLGKSYESEQSFQKCPQSSNDRHLQRLRKQLLLITTKKLHFFTWIRT